MEDNKFPKCFFSTSPGKALEAGCFKGEAGKAGGGFFVDGHYTVVKRPEKRTNKTGIETSYPPIHAHKAS